MLNLGDVLQQRNVGQLQVGVLEPALASDLIQVSSVHVLLAEEEGVVVGFCAGALNRPLSEHVGCGIASVLLLAVDAADRASGRSGTWLGQRGV